MSIWNFITNLFAQPYRYKKFDDQGREKWEEDHSNKTRLYIKFGLIFGIPILSIILVLSAFRLYHISGSSMDPTFHDGQRIILQKWPKTWADLRGKTYIPNRYDSVVIDLPDEKEHIIKRVLALPGERIIINNNNVIVFTQQYPEGHKVDDEAPSSVIQSGELTDGNVDVTLGEDEIFVLGDNRTASEDSRHFGPVSVKNIVGKY